MQYIDLNRQYEYIKEKMDSSIAEVLNTGNYILGKQVDTVERRLAKFVGRKHCITVANGTDALVLALRALNVGVGDVVFVPDFTFFASAECVSAVGATPIFVDVCSDTFNIDTADLERKILLEKSNGNTTKAIIPVDLFGLPANYSAIEEIAKKYNLFVLEDGAQGFGGTFNGRRVCSFGDIAITSFFPAKPLGVYGDGGAIFCDDDLLNEILRSLRVHGKGVDKYDNVCLGTNSRLDTLQAAILHCKLDIFEEELVKRDLIANKYTAALNNYIKVPVVPDNYSSVWAQYTLQTEKREYIKQICAENDIPTMVYYPKAMHMQTVYESFGLTDNEYPISSLLCDTVLSIPMHPYLTDEEINRVCDTIIKAL